MKKVSIILSAMILLGSIQLHSQDDSVYFNRLYYTCKAWGFVKYFHSELANCSLNWDSVLIAKIPEIKDAVDDDAFNDILLDLINSPGETEIPSTQLPIVPDSLMFNLNVEWFNDDIFSEEVHTALDTLSERFRPRPHCMVQQAFYNGNPTFDYDDQFHSDVGYYPDEEIRLLAFFRYWNMINYFFPYKYIMDQSWDETLSELIPMFYQAENATEYSMAIKIMAKRINDSHAFVGGGVSFSMFGTFYPRFAIGYFEDETVIYKVHSSVTEVKPGDIIRAIDGLDIGLVRDSLEQYARGSNDISIRFYTNQLLLPNSGGSFEITVENETGIHDYTLNRNWNYTSFNNFLSPTGPVWYDTVVNQSCSFGYVDMAQLTTTHIPDMMEALWETDAIIFDIRNYPQGTLWTLVNYLFTEPIHIASFTHPDIQYPGTLGWKDEFIGINTSSVYEGQLIILFDNRTISQAEYTCMGLEQHPGSIKIGSTTKAADGNVSKVYLPGSVFTYFTGLGTFYPDYTPTQRVGIIPDIEIWPSIEGIRQEKDEVLEYAFNCLLLKQEEIPESLPQTPIELYPVPFTQNTTLSYTIHRQIPSTIEIFDLFGKRVQLVQTEDQEAGTHELVLHGEGLHPGIYFCVVSNIEGKQIRKLIKK